MNLLYESPKGVVDLRKASELLGVTKRRLYDIVNVLQGVGILKKFSVNKVQLNSDQVNYWHNFNAGLLRDIVNSLENEEKVLDERLEECKEIISRLSYQAGIYSYLPYNDLVNVAEYVDQTLLIVKAPLGAEFNVQSSAEGIQLQIKSTREEIEVTPMTVS